ncbi:isocitrate/isopropylmalate dehydrogenase family protein [Kribbella deserti]|uniref:Isocitrate/isopropylmalate dehydrogenase family protein n=1 Tax=Kribbella deserti TaxID=1926257 RepID=A0ABV6QN48_9ACTN
MKLAVIPGDGIGSEVIDSALRVLRRTSRVIDSGISWDVFDWGAERWLTDGVGLPDGAPHLLRANYDAVLLGALGDPRIPDMAHGREILLGLRQGLDLCVNYRPVVLPGGTVHLYRENTQGLYAGVGGAIRRGGIAEVAIDECVYTRETVERFLRYSLSDLQRRGSRRVTLVHKSNAVPNTGSLWQDVFRRELREFPDLAGNEQYVDAFCYHLVRNPTQFDGVVTSNLFGDVVSDIGAALMGGLGLAASASISPDTGFALFEPVHGSAPDIAGLGIANPYAVLMCVVLLLRHCGFDIPADALEQSLSDAVRTEVTTPDLGGIGTTDQFTGEVLRQLDLKLPAIDRDRKRMDR